MTLATSQRYLAYASVMNATKWRALADAIRAIPGFMPRVRFRFLGEEIEPEFGHPDWEWVRLGTTTGIEWLEIDSCQKTIRGRLIAQYEEDFGDKVEAALRQAHVPFSRDGHLFMVRGYIRPGE